MRRISRTRRALLATLAVVQMAVPALVAVADAELAIRARGSAQSHVEDHTRKNCRPVHADDCALCRLLSHSTPQRAEATLVPAADSAPVRHCSDASQLPSPATRALERTRAPPPG
ncbi:MAG: hypothetical protein ACHQQ3_05570 [Gemmatimonadales bacterium]